MTYLHILNETKKETTVKELKDHCEEYMTNDENMGCGECKYRRFCEEFIKNNKYLRDTPLELLLK